ncbi:hypothetical protein L3Y34_000905 [Caenorhabditis briggsae]|uniref:Uncharacterized protein n=1 Tax=Caenorhabditis briggsae TaxID=6238 RepID=A0AAE9IPM0_CAEBR|nr:hypothetical protein L3Y34_000905 [Caenorhabditis briggsae]
MHVNTNEVTLKIRIMSRDSRYLLAGGNNTLHSEQIRAEIQRFESVHPCIYQIYDLLNLLPDGCHAISEQIREQIVSVEELYIFEAFKALIAVLAKPG